MNFPTKITAYTIAILFTYSLIVIFVKPNAYIAQHQWQNNDIQAQKFLYDNHSTNVIIGSSLSARLDMYDEKDYYNLAFAGQGALDGLKLLLNKEKLPERVFIEMNTILVEENKNFTGSLLNPFFYELRKIDPAFRDGKQPLGISARIISEGVSYISGAPKKTTKIDAASQPANIKRKTTNSLFNELLRNQKEDYSFKPTEATLSKIFIELTNYIEFLKRKNVEVIFFEMPVNAELCMQPKSVAIRNSFLKHFAPTTFRYIPQPDCNGYQTSDGLHLGLEESIRYKKYFMSHASKINK